MDELKPQESEALDIIESLLDVADMKNTGPMYADNPPRSGMCRIPEEDAAKLRQYIAARRTAPENKALTLEQLREMDGEPVWTVPLDGTGCGEWTIIAIGAQIEMLKALSPDTAYEECNYGKTWLAYARKPEGSENI